MRKTVLTCSLCRRNRPLAAYEPVRANRCLFVEHSPSPPEPPRAFQLRRTGPQLSTVRRRTTGRAAYLTLSGIYRRVDWCVRMSTEPVPRG